MKKENKNGIIIEKRGGITTPIRLFATIWKNNKKIAEKEVEINKGIICMRGANE